MTRTTLSVDENIANQLASIAREKKMTLYAFVNEILDNAVKLFNEGADIKTAYELWAVHKLLSEVDAVILPSDFMDSIISDVCKYNEQELYKKFRQLGHETATLIRIYARDLDELIQLAVNYSKYLPLKRIEARYLGNGTYEVGIVGAGGVIESTRCINEFIKGLLEAYQVAILENEISKSVIHLKLKQ